MLRHLPPTRYVIRMALPVSFWIIVQNLPFANYHLLFVLSSFFFFVKMGGLNCNMFPTYCKFRRLNLSNLSIVCHLEDYRIYRLSLLSKSKRELVSYREKKMVTPVTTLSLDALQFKLFSARSHESTSAWQKPHHIPVLLPTGRPRNLTHFADVIWVVMQRFSSRDDPTTMLRKLTPYTALLGLWNQ